VHNRKASNADERVLDATMGLQQTTDERRQRLHFNSHGRNWLEFKFLNAALRQTRIRDASADVSRKMQAQNEQLNSRCTL